MKEFDTSKHGNSIIIKWLLLPSALFFYSPIIADTISLQIDKVLIRASNYENVNSDSALYYANSALIISREYNRPKKEYASTVLLLKNNIKAGKFGKAISNSFDAQKIVDSRNLTEFKVEVKILSGVAYLAMGLSADALGLFLEAQNELSSETSFIDRVDLHYFTGSAYAELMEFDKCKTYLIKSIATSISNNYSLGAFKSYILLSNISEKLDSINKYLGLANNVLIEYPDLLYKKVVLRNEQALLNKAIGNNALSKKQYIEAISISRNNGFQSFLANLYNNYAYLLMAESKIDSAGFYLGEALEIAQNIKSTDLQASIYDSHSDYYTTIKQYQTALKYQDSSIVMRNKYRDEQRIQESLFLSVVFETEQKEKEILQQKNEISSLWLIQLGGVTVLIIVIGFVVYFRQKFLLSRSRLETVEKGRELELANTLIQGQDAERKRLAMDLHDGLGARLGSLRFIVDAF